MPTLRTNVENAANIVASGLHVFAGTIAESEREDFFHPMNRDMWMCEFCNWLSAKQRKSAEQGASND